MTRTSVPASIRCVAKLWRSVCSVLPGFLMPARCLAELNDRCSWRGDSGLILGLPGNSQPSGLASRQYPRSSARAAASFSSLSSEPPICRLRGPNRQTGAPIPKCQQVSSARAASNTRPCRASGFVLVPRCRHFPSRLFARAANDRSGRSHRLDSQGSSARTKSFGINCKLDLLSYYGTANWRNHLCLTVTTGRKRIGAWWPLRQGQRRSATGCAAQDNPCCRSATGRRGGGSDAQGHRNGDGPRHHCHAALP